ncbi:MAG TPA: hypothetical protein VGQ20_18330 [Acidimicrobiales bacterium]|nr:hypothetical protein [Acidimicrobiales bacterium]
MIVGAMDLDWGTASVQPIALDDTSREFAARVLPPPYRDVTPTFHRCSVETRTCLPDASLAARFDELRSLSR